MLTTGLSVWWHQRWGSASGGTCLEPSPVGCTLRRGIGGHTGGASPGGGSPCAPHTPALCGSQWLRGFVECDILHGEFRPAGLACLLQEVFQVLMQTGARARRVWPEMHWAFHPGFLEPSPSDPASHLTDFQEAVWQTAPVCAHRSKWHFVVSELVS